MRGGSETQVLGEVAHRLADHGWSELVAPAPMQAALHDLHAAAEWFFAQPLAHKLAFDIRDSVGHRGYVPVDEQGGYSDEGERRYEAFDIGRDEQPGDLIAHPLRGVNRWPDHPPFVRAAQLGFAKFASLADQLCEAICAFLDVPVDALRAHRREPVSQLRLIHYLAPRVIDLSSNSSAMGAHTDYEFLTLIFQSEPGLEILDADGNWVEPEFEPGRLLVLVGDLFEVFSGGRLISTLHRAAGAVAAGRISTPYFAGADFSARVRSVTGADLPEVAFGDHLMRQLRRDFPYLRSPLVHEPRSGGSVVIDLTGSTPFERLSSFERERLRAAGGHREVRGR